MTGVPWPPGRRELRFTYLLPNLDGHYVWRRPLDLPSAEVRVWIRADSPPEAICNLTPVPLVNKREIAFESGHAHAGGGIPAARRAGGLPVSPMRYAPAGALAALAGLIVLISLGVARSRRS